ncbi:MAG: DNA-directed RNA polymerase subunit alpha [Armatimonadetes bacterium]|nr:DNA-directed RNA polymerase subunit alpha [Armatimonadota bacterium]
MEAITPRIEALSQTDTYGKFLVEPLERGFGTTLGNSLRRILLSSIPGAAITSVKIEGVLHEFSTIPGVKEDTTELLLNLKDLHIKLHHDGAGRPEPKTIWIDVKGAGEVTGADIRTPAEVEIVNPELHIATISDESASLSMEMTVELGKGYVLPEKHERIKSTIGVIPVGAAFTPVRKVNFIVEPTRVGHRTDFERLILEIWTTGAISPKDALGKSAEILERHIRLFRDFAGGAGTESLETQGIVGDEAQPAVRDVRIEELDFSVRTYNCLKKANIMTIGELVQISEQDLMGIRNFGKKSLAEVKEKLAQMGLSLKKVGGESATDDIESEQGEEAEAEY